MKAIGRAAALRARVRLDRVIEEAAVGTLAVGGVTYGVYIVTDSTGNE